MGFELPAEKQELAPLNLGSQSALQSAAPLAPAESALPAPPPGYMPGYSSPVRRAEQDSFLYRMGEVLSAGGTQPGDIPAPLKLRLAQASADREASQTKLAWDNFYAHNRVAQDVLKQHNQDAMTQGLAMLPQFKGIVHAIEDPAERTAMATHLGKMLDSYTPGLGAVMRAMDKNPAQVLGADMMLNHPTYGPMFKDILNTVGYEKFPTDPRTVQLTEVFGRDTIPLITSRFTVDEQKKLASGSMTQPEFVKAYDTAAKDESFGAVKPTNLAFAKSILNTPYGEEIMAGMGVKLNKAAVKLEAKVSSSGNPMNAAKYQELKRVDAEIALETENPTATSKQKIEQLQERRDILLRVQSPQGSPGESKSNIFSHDLVNRSGGKMQTASDLQNFEVGSPEYAQGLKWIGEANEVAKTASSQAGLQAKLQMPADIAKGNFYSRKQLREGKIVPITTPMSTGARLTNPDVMDLSPDEIKKFTNIQASQQAGKSLFDMASKVMTATSGPGLATQVAIFHAFDSPLTAPMFAASHPEMKVYHDLLNAWAGNNAKALGGEVGVLTNVDIDRWVKTFPGPTDTPKIVASKRKVFNQMVDLVRSVNASVLAGDAPAERDANGYLTNKDVRQKIEGLLGSAEGLGGEHKLEVKPTRSRADVLIEKMQSGK